MALSGSRQKNRLTGPQIRAARALINWSAEDLSRHSSVSLRTIRRAEVAGWQTAMTAANDLAVRRALEFAGVEFTNHDQPGVRLAKAAATRLAEPARPRKPGTKAVSSKTAKATEKEQ